MAECDWIVLCDFACMVMPGKLSMIGIFDNIYAGDLPYVHERSFLGFSVIGQPGESIVQKLEIIGPTGAVITGPVEQRFTLPDSGSVQVAIEIKGMKLNDYGRHAIQVDLGQGQSKSAWFTLTPVPTQTQG